MGTSGRRPKESLPLCYNPSMQFTFLTGNQHKAEHLAKWLGRPIKHHKLDLDEIQSLDIHAVTEHKVRQAYAVLGTPTLVEDVALTFTAAGRLPGTFVKWFIEEVGNEGLCKFADTLEHREAIASVCYALYDGKKLHFFENHVKGTVAPKPRGERGFGWDPVFIPDGQPKTYAELEDHELQPYSVRAAAVDKLKKYLQR